MHQELERDWPNDDAAWDAAAKERFSLCLRCRSAPRQLSASIFFCSPRCEAAFFGRGADWSEVYREEVARTAGRSTPTPPSIDGPEEWGLRNFVRRGAYLDLPTGRSYRRERSWPRASLPAIDDAGGGVRPPIALGGRVGHLAEVEPPAPPLGPDLELSSRVVGRSAPLPPNRTEGTSP